MDIHGLTCFRLAYESGSIGKAAKRAYLTRQGFSGALKSVEAEWGHPLFVRGPLGLEPTELAHAVYPKVVEALAAYDEVQLLCAADSRPVEAVGLGVAYGALLSLSLDEMVAAFAGEGHRMSLDIDIVEPVLAAQCVAEGGKDLVLVAGSIDAPGTRCVSLCRIPLCAAVHESLLADGRNDVEGLRGITWFGLSETFPLDRALVAFSRERKLGFVMDYRWHDYHLILDQMRQKRGACIVPARTAERFCQGGIVAIALDDSRLTWEVSAIVPNARPLSRAAGIVLAWLERYLA